MGSNESPVDRSAPSRVSTTRTRDGRGEGDGDRRWLILNPTSGGGDHADRVRRLAEDRGYVVAETSGEGDGVDLAREAVADGATLVAAAGGDGTFNETIRGLVAADACKDVTTGVVPVGTANIFAGLVGLDRIRDGFDVLETGETRVLDLGMADDRPFLLSCLAGLQAEVSVDTPSSLKAQWGALAFLITAFRGSSDFDGIDLRITAVSDEGERTWSGSALVALVGNLRRFGVSNRNRLADAEDGLFDVVVVERRPAHDLLADATVRQLFGDPEYVTRMRASELEIDGLDEDLTFSLDGERLTTNRLHLDCRPRSIRVKVGSSYERP